MKTIHLVILAVMAVLLLACTKESFPVELENIHQTGIPKTTLSNGPGCTIHILKPCPPDCFSAGGPHICMNPGHCNLHKIVTEITPDEGGGEKVPGNNNGDENSQVCEKCASCLACKDIKNGYPYTRHLHTCCNSDSNIKGTH